MLEHNRLTAALPPIARWCFLAVLMLVMAAPASAADQVIDISDGQRTGKLVIAVGKSETILVSEPFQDVVLGNPGIASMAPLTDRSLYVLGVAIGTTNLAFYDSAGDLIAVIDIEVTHDLSDLREALHKAVPSASVNVRSANGRVMLDGTVPDAVALDRVLSIAREFAREAGQDEAGRVINALSVASSQQVMLEVRIIEASRNLGRDLGVNWSVQAEGFRFSTFRPFPGAPAAPLAQGGTPFGSILADFLAGGARVDVLIQALEEKGIARRLAEPNLIALSGQPARFHAGGEFPVTTTTIVEGEDGSVTTRPEVQFKKFGVLLGFTPTVLADGIINLKIEPEVSDVDFSLAVQGNPGIRTRTASTMVELRDGQSMAMAGLMQSNHSRQADQVPWLGDVPVLGALFRSSGFQRSETELVVIVTPRLVVPVPPGVALATPLDNLAPSNDPELVLLGKLEVSKEYLHLLETGGAVKGPFGHMLDLPKDKKHVTTK